MLITYNINSNQTVEEVFESVLHINFIQLKKYELIALEAKDSEGVHQMRVSLRRMRSLLCLYKSILPKKKSNILSEEIHYIGLKLDFARDLDVYIEEHFSKKELSSIEKLMYELALKHKKQEYKKVQKLLKSQRLGNLHSLIYDWIEIKDLKYSISNKKQKRFQENIIPFAIEIMDKFQDKVILKGANIDELDDEALHKLRILCKKLRYATDFFVSLFSTKLLLFRNHLKKLQDILGILHDQSVTKKIHENLLKGQTNIELYKFAHELEIEQKNKGVELKKLLKIEWEIFLQFKQPLL